MTSVERNFFCLLKIKYKKWQHFLKSDGSCVSLIWGVTGSIPTGGNHWTFSCLFLYLCFKFKFFMKFIEAFLCWDAFMTSYHGLWMAFMCHGVMKLCLYINMAMICIIWQLNYMGVLSAQSKYLKHFLTQDKELHEGDTNGRLARPQRYPLNRQFKNGRRRFD